ncbi:hypothetical protein N481_13260 [Pseudoalteromonas luteoviolacea S4047-1]|uniref:Uncharacterized protein n=1 Tax=Pseudoalteromonas luteoviolacea S4054 TaxID=1129367 RepID=A0A0F6AHE9_9GAMM|nr:hypothetical protein N479_04570 [Pseudoalteromonas luteoviolacea S4054]KZN73016.1 hypothetical protein N481_13260 [Pseudoalteromonas luteoviolacea S4047-1]
MTDWIKVRHITAYFFEFHKQVGQHTLIIETVQEKN